MTQLHSVLLSCWLHSFSYPRHPWSPSIFADGLSVGISWPVRPVFSSGSQCLTTTQPPVGREMVTLWIGCLSFFQAPNLAPLCLPSWIAAWCLGCFGKQCGQLHLVALGRPIQLRGHPHLEIQIFSGHALESLHSWYPLVSRMDQVSSLPNLWWLGHPGPTPPSSCIGRALSCLLVPT